MKSIAREQSADTQESEPTKWLTHEAIRALRTPIADPYMRIAFTLITLANKHGQARVGLRMIADLCHVHRTTLRRALKEMASRRSFAAHTQFEADEGGGRNPVTYRLGLRITEQLGKRGENAPRLYTLVLTKKPGYKWTVDRMGQGVHDATDEDEDLAGF